MYLVPVPGKPTKCNDCNREVSAWRIWGCPLCRHEVFVCPFDGCFEGSVEDAARMHLSRHEVIPASDVRWCLIDNYYSDPPEAGCYLRNTLLTRISKRFKTRLYAYHMSRLIEAGAVEALVGTNRDPAQLGGMIHIGPRAITVWWYQIVDDAKLIAFVRKLKRERKTALERKHICVEAWLLFHGGVDVNVIARRLKTTPKRVKALVQLKDRKIIAATKQLRFSNRPWAKRLRRSNAL